ncbi:MAG: glutamate racemase [Bdellovibrionaceae bacterium]|nr:glutamate racemase [Pseudobdellovibrionaceae bacterium]MCB9092900.1 glutamate racemase [Halobacteriovoraceae bacterium]
MSLPILKIGVFDSGLGGLTVLKSLFEKAPQNQYFYLGDTARLPYGSKSPKVLRKYIDQNVQFLLTKKVDAIVVACNSASSVIENLNEFPVPVFDVIKPSARAAVTTSLEERIGIIATRTTISQKTYVKAIQSLNPLISVFQQACPLLVPLVEEAWLEDPITNLVLYRYLSALLQAQVDTLILGCTHYPLLLPAIRKVVGPDINIISSANCVVDEVLLHFKLPINNEKLDAKIELYLTDASPSLDTIYPKIFFSPAPQPELIYL